MKFKGFFAAVTACAMLLQTAAFAAVLGSEVASQTTQIADNTYLSKNMFMSDQNGVGMQTEYYCEYKPNENVRPVVVNGDSIYGKRTIMQAAEYMQKNDMQPMIGINADFFSTKTGVPMGHTIMNGEIVTKDATGQDAIGFKKDGSAFVSWLEISTVLKTETDSFYIDNINKYRQAGAVPAFLLTDAFGDNTHASTWGIDVVLSNIEGKLAIGETLTATIEDIGYNDGAIPIEKGKMVLTMDCKGYEETYLKMQNLKIGEKVTITNTLVYDDERWLDAESALGSVGGRLLGGGVINPELNASAAPRTAIGVKPDGNIIFYVLDGRQKGYSYGAKLTTIAKRLAELGCTDAINFDGGGSTSIAGVYPGSGVMSVINSPSDGSLRRVANFVFLQNMQKPTGVTGKLYLYPTERYYMNGITEKIDIKAVDTAFYNTAVPNDVKYNIAHTDSTVTEDGAVTFRGDGEVIIEASSELGGAYGNVSVYTYRTPTDIVIRREDTGENTSSVRLSMGETLDFSALSYAGYNQMKSQDNAFEWTVEGGVGTVDKNGLFKAADAPGAVGRLLVTAGEKTVSVDISINDVDPSEKYPKIYIDSESETGVLKIYASSLGSKMPVNNITLRIDGEYMNENDIARSQTDEYNAAVSYTLPEDFMLSQHKIRVDARNDAGMLSCAALTLGRGLPDDGFEDTSNHWAKKVIAYMSSKNIVSGIREQEKSYFKPNDNITRAQLAVIMCNYLGLDISGFSGMQTPFEDDYAVPKWANAQVTAVYARGILAGRERDGKLYFDPNEPVTRAEMVTVMGRILPAELYSAKLDFMQDYEKVPEWSSDGFERMVGGGFMKGYEDNTLRPLNYITRAETLQILYNIM